MSDLALQNGKVAGKITEAEIYHTFWWFDLYYCLSHDTDRIYTYRLTPIRSLISNQLTLQILIRET